MLLSGCHLNIGEMPDEVAKRELLEEIGVEPNLIYSKSEAPFFMSQIETVGLTAGILMLIFGRFLKVIPLNQLTTKVRNL